MNKLTMYGIPNCDSIKKARQWLQDADIAYQFHNYKKDGVDAVVLASWCEVVGWEVLLNKRGTTWRKLSDDDKTDVDQLKAIDLMLSNPSMIKRPVLVVANETESKIEVGFKAERYEGLLV